MTKADDGVAPTLRGTTHTDTPGGSGSVGVAELTHELVRGQLTEYLDGSLGESDRRRIEGHLASCLSCTAYVRTFQATVQALGKLPAPKAPTSVRNKIVEQARQEAADANPDA